MRRTRALDPVRLVSSRLVWSPPLYFYLSTATKTRFKFFVNDNSTSDFISVVSWAHATILPGLLPLPSISRALSATGQPNHHLTLILLLRSCSLLKKPWAMRVSHLSPVAEAPSVRVALHLRQRVLDFKHCPMHHLSPSCPYCHNLHVRGFI